METLISDKPSIGLSSFNFSRNEPSFSAKSLDRVIVVCSVLDYLLESFVKTIFRLLLFSF